MLTILNTSLLESDAQTLVNTVNTVGVMGKGLASHFKLRYPDMYASYKDVCARGLLDIGKLWLWKSPTQWVLNFPTKTHWRYPSRIEYIQAGLEKFVATYETKGITQIGFPRLGCGNGGLEWNSVRALMEAYLSPLPIDIQIHDYDEPIGAPEHLKARPKTLVSRSLDQFITDLQSLIVSRSGRFRTISAESNFNAQLSDDANLLIRRSGKKSIIPREELVEAWQVLIRGPLTKRRLIGRAYDEASYVLGLLASLPYTRSISLTESDASSPTTGVEIIHGASNRQELRA
jgi:O-acetyl-ADP-ribose deacetylase (regulator of RNase III)